MIRNVVLGVLKPGVTTERLDAALAAVRGLAVTGLDARVVAGRDLGLRQGNASYAITVDVASEADLVRFDRDPEHDRVRRELLVPISRSMQQVQFRLPG
ncbi:Dabb family protein [Nocardioides sp. ChNu-99]|uniref:Dabb family protein n=1 Tax=Nocardioides sp. ChNu-99 TaxID=2839897 RepID=UPI002405D837|nr:Dabb family protein [Nocardioides sp. ChNu-99]MDF9716148.1 Dabb family protein [Nocardioides sp. ChNu-99]